MRTAQACARSDSSTACTDAAGTSCFRLRAIAPDPVHRSTTTGARRSASARSRSSGDGEAGHHLGLGPRDEDTRADRQLEVAERRPAGEVLQRHAPGPLGHQRLHGLQPGRGVGAEDHQPAHVAGAGAQGMCGQRDGVDVGLLHAGRGELPGRRPDRVPQGAAHGAEESWASAVMRAASSASTADCTSGSSSPSSTVSRL